MIALSLTGGLVHVADASSVASEAVRSCAKAVDLPAPVPPIGVGPCPMVRPGDVVYAELGDSSRTCTIGFFYRDRRNDTYFATGGDCAPPFAFAEPVTTWPRGRGPVAMDGRTGNRIGEFAFRFADGDVRLSLVRVDPAVPFSPQVCHFGGPTGTSTDVSSDPAQLVMVGPEAGALDWDAPPFGSTDGSVLRPGVAHFGLYDKDSVIVTGQSMVEDGLPVMTSDGLAVGTAEWLGSAYHPPVLNIGIIVTRPRRPIAEAERALRTKLTLLTAPLL